MKNKWKNSWKSPEYNAWVHMLHRCYNPKDKAYKSYGKLGIFVCDDWRNNFDKFFEDVGPRPSADYSLDRIDSFDGYKPENCRWATRITQANNKRSTRRVEVNGEAMSAREISEKFGLDYQRVRSRICQGFSPEKIIQAAPIRRTHWEHGTIYAYIAKKCRCDPCKLAKRQNRKATSKL